MARAKTPAQRQKIIQTWQEEQLTFSDLAKRFGYSYNTVKNICKNYQQRGDSSLIADYSSCGRKVTDLAERSYRLVRLIRHFHPDWGVPFILTKIEQDFPDVPLQKIRNYQTRLAKERPKKKLPPSIVPKSKAMGRIRLAHDEWQIDAKERIKLPTGEEVCYLSITDTKTNGMLKAKPFSLCQN